MPRVMLILHASRNAIPLSASKADDGMENFLNAAKHSVSWTLRDNIACLINWLYVMSNSDWPSSYGCKLMRQRFGLSLKEREKRDEECDALLFPEE